MIKCLALQDTSFSRVHLLRKVNPGESRFPWATTRGAFPLQLEVGGRREGDGAATQLPGFEARLRKPEFSHKWKCY